MGALASRGLPLALVTLTFLTATAPRSRAGGELLPVGFVTETIGSGWSQPVGLWYLDAQRLLVAEKAGRVWYVEAGLKKNLVLDLSSEVLTPTDRGLLGIAAHPQFDLNGWLYLLLVVDPDGDGVDDEQESFSRLVRYALSWGAGGDLLADPQSRTDLLGAAWSTGLPSCHWSHAIGNLRFLSDGSLVLTCGDGAHYDGLDLGGRDPGCFVPGAFPASEDIGAYRSAVKTSLAGKVLRIDPATGLGLPDNPWFTGDPAAPASRAWAMGLRNPFRFTTLAGTGPTETLVVGDVGWSLWEELDLCFGGEHFGWPCLEGPDQTAYLQLDPYGVCAGVTGTAAAPLVAYHHSQLGGAGFKGSCISGVAQYTGASYPPAFQGALFFCDFVRGWLRTARLAPDLSLSSLDLFGDSLGNPIDLASEPGSGDLVYIDLATNSIRALRYVGSDLPPVALAQANPAWGAAPLTVDLWGGASFDPEGQPLAYHWDLGDGSTAMGPAVQHVYSGAVNSTAVLTVSDPFGHSASAAVLISPDNTPPTIANVLSPPDGFVYLPSEPIALAADASDVEDAAAGLPLAATWTADLVRGHSVHPAVAQSSGLSGTMTLGPYGPGIHHRLTLCVTDSRGLTEEAILELYDATSPPLPHLVSLSDKDVRLGQAIRGTGHVEYAIEKAGWPRPDLTWDWGDGTHVRFPSVGHQEDVTPTHAYAQVGDYTLSLTVQLAGYVDTITQTISVREAHSAVAVFQPLISNRWIPWKEQQAIAQALETTLCAAGREVALFTYDQQAQLAAWMAPYVDDGVCDVVVVLDTIPAALYSGEDDGSLVENWLEHGNGIVWSGYEAFYEYIDTDGFVTDSGARTHGSDEVLDALSLPSLCRGAGVQILTALGQHDLPGLAQYFAQRAVRYDALGPAWKVEKLYASDSDKDSDAIAIRHASGGHYAQFFGTDLPGLPRAQVILQFLATYPNMSWHGPQKR